MLKPQRISSKETNNILKRIADIAKKETLSQLDEDLLQKSSIYQYELPELPNNQIILAYDVMLRLTGCAACSNYFERYQEEFGGYLFGYSKGNFIVFHSYNETPQTVEDKMFNTSNEMVAEICKKEMEDDVNCVCHVHTHPYSKHHYSSTPSNQDLYLYAWFNEQFSSGNKKIDYLGALITPTEDTKDSFNDICFIFYDKENKKFYKATNIFYFDEFGTITPLEKKKYNQTRNNIVESVEERVVLHKKYDF